MKTHNFFVWASIALIYFGSLLGCGSSNSSNSPASNNPPNTSQKAQADLVNVNGDAWVQAASMTTMLKDNVQHLIYDEYDCFEAGKLFGSAKALGDFLESQIQHWTVNDEKSMIALGSGAQLIQGYSSITKCEEGKEDLPRFLRDIENLDKALQIEIQRR